MLDKIFENFCPDDYDDVHIAFDKISGIYSDSKIHHLVGNQYLKEPESTLIELDLPRQSGKSTWIKSQFCNYPEDTIVVYPSAAMRQLHFQGYFDFSKNTRIITTTSIDRLSQYGYGKIGLILFDEVCSYHGRLKSKTLLSQLMAGGSCTSSTKCVSLYTAP